ncbi:class I SAM-dependent methyltransferase [Aquibacillus albus]|uniref:Site-specific DNA-methyltransferase (Adenine-specific) n=1 Tax=Aquibacillus albus TaxID=1168171 RepID=A0ABS2N3Z3_9BACI|nr:class I SAM-dependent methyltransferase [Aquibacillus albus]MBM7572861.1 site-specific DNA-methyltransferase (adenine-specific) [Aquibacillus albus]
MEQTNVEKLFSSLDEVSELIQQQLDHPYIEGLAYGLELLFTQEPTENINDSLKAQLISKVKEIDLKGYEKEEIRKAIQLAILKGMQGATQQQHLVTPDTVAMFIGYLVQKLTEKNEIIRLFDPACGSANLLTAVINQLHQKTQAYGSEVDPTLIQLALMNANLQETEVEFFHQDSLQPFLLEPVDCVISDLPVGYYPNDFQASKYELKSNEGHSYAHHLFIEQSLNYVKDGGFLIFVIPNNLFVSDQADKLQSYLHNHAHVIGLLQLPLSMFKSENNAKSIFILQKKGQTTTAPKQALLAQLPSFKNVKAMNDILEKINLWFKNERY